MSDFWNAFWAHLFSVDNAETLAGMITAVGGIFFIAIFAFGIVSTFVGIIHYMVSKRGGR